MLIKWVEDKSKTAKVIWLHGTAGIGKSAVAQHISERYAAKGGLAATFFFSRNDPTRDKLDPFVASIAYQFLREGSALRAKLGPTITEAILKDPKIFDASYEKQLKKLILGPCLELESTLQDDLPSLLVIDGLDECVDHASQERAVGLIRSLLACYSPLLWTILVCSRPERQIRDAFRHPAFDGVLWSLDMNSMEDLNRDIERYFIDQFAALREKHRNILKREGRSWPGGHVVDELVRRADKQMIFAATVIKYIDTYDELPQDRLATILRIRIDGAMDSPYSALDALYSQILSTCAHQWHKLHFILRLLVTPHYCPVDLKRFDHDIAWRSPATIALFCNLKKGEVRIFLDKLHSVLRIPRHGADKKDKNVYIAHASFTEFMVDPERSRDFHTPRMTNSEYSDCLATFSLRVVSSITRRYPPYYRQSQSFTEALLDWDQEYQKDHADLSFSIQGWALFTDVSAPRSELSMRCPRLIAIL
ncbi:hypothetical protein VNI00_012698 [Paramarasmius palmivorus]|uniref:Nephrocystin 3-like N-terminal domain-containing protein n=1 Tax=Paramarasmius palmivorus TaxID=297713 RepID=A0AAW0C545_9AGAR